MNYNLLLHMRTYGQRTAVPIGRALAILMLIPGLPLLAAPVFWKKNWKVYV